VVLSNLSFLEVDLSQENLCCSENNKLVSASLNLFSSRPSEIFAKILVIDYFCGFSVYLDCLSIHSFIPECQIQVHFLDHLELD
jgi:hypothetical protein